MSVDAPTRWHTQTLAGGGHVPPELRGDCVPACITSILGLPLSAVPNDHHGPEWWDRLNYHLDRLGYCIAVIDIQLEPPRGYWIATLPSLNLPPDPGGKPAMHSIVCRFYEFVHDPSLGKRYDEASWTEAWNDDKVVEGWVLTPLDPSRLLSEHSEEQA